MHDLILNIGAGKSKPLVLKTTRRPYYLINLDRNYFSGLTPNEVESNYEGWRGLNRVDNGIAYVNSDVYEFLERTYLKFDHISMYRFLEHVPFTKIPYFIYLLSQVTEPEAKIDIIVPNFKLLGKILAEELHPRAYEQFEGHNIFITTELLNETYDPHASIWTPDRVEYFFELEGYFRFMPETLKEGYPIDGRETYFRCMVERTE
jgi:hypothetical protein